MALAFSTGHTGLITVSSAVPYETSTDWGISADMVFRIHNVGPETVWIDAQGNGAHSPLDPIANGMFPVLPGRVSDELPMPGALGSSVTIGCLGQSQIYVMVKLAV